MQELALELVSRGWRVGIATTSTTHSPADDPPGMEVRRVQTWLAFTRASLPRRTLSYLSIFPALLRAASALPGKWDYVVTTSDPPLQVLLGSMLQRSAKCRLVQWSQDLYPELAEELGVLRRRGIAATALRAMSDLGLRRSSCVIVPGRCMADRMRERGVSSASIHVVPNWSPARTAAPADTTAFRKKHGIRESHFVVMYSGNFGLAHSFDSVLHAADYFRSSRPEIRFLLIGGGPRLAEVHADVERLALTNVQFLPLQPREDLSVSLAAADVHLITMRESVAGLVVPSKFYGVVAAGRPCLFVGPRNSEVAQVITESGCGAVVGEFEMDALVTAIASFADDSEKRSQAAAHALAIAGEYTVSASTDKLLSAMRSAETNGGERV